MNQDNEIWKDIDGYGCDYQVSNLGRIKSKKKYPSIILRKGVGAYGYHLACLYKNNCKKTFPVSRLVASAFIPNPKNKPVVHHIDCDVKNNQAKNLEWVTVLENVRYARLDGLVSDMKGTSNANAKINEKDIKGIFWLLKNRYSVNDIAYIFDLSVSHVYSIKNRKSWRHI